MSININEYQWASMSINEHQWTSMNMHESGWIWIDINQYQEICRNINKQKCIQVNTIEYLPVTALHRRPMRKLSGKDFPPWNQCKNAYYDSSLFAINDYIWI